MARIKKTMVCPAARRCHRQPLSPASFFTQHGCACPHRVTPKVPRPHVHRPAPAPVTSPSPAMARPVPDAVINNPGRKPWRTCMCFAIFVAVALSLAWPLSEMLAECFVPPCEEPPMTVFFGPKASPHGGYQQMEFPHEDASGQEVISDEDHLYGRRISPKFRMFVLNENGTPDSIEISSHNQHPSSQMAVMDGDGISETRGIFATYKFASDTVVQKIRSTVGGMVKRVEERLASLRKSIGDEDTEIHQETAVIEEDSNQDSTELVESPQEPEVAGDSEYSIYVTQYDIPAATNLVDISPAEAELLFAMDDEDDEYDDAFDRSFYEGSEHPPMMENHEFFFDRTYHMNPQN